MLTGAGGAAAAPKSFCLSKVSQLTFEVWHGKEDKVVCEELSSEVSTLPISGTQLLCRFLSSIQLLQQFCVYRLEGSLGVALIGALKAGDWIMYYSQTSCLYVSLPFDEVLLKCALNGWAHLAKSNSKNLCTLKLFFKWNTCFTVPPHFVIFVSFVCSVSLDRHCLTLVILYTCLLEKVFIQNSSQQLFKELSPGILEPAFFW